MARLTVSGGWLHVTYDGPDAAVVWLAVADRSGDPDWQPAFLDYLDGERVAKIRAPLDAPDRGKVLMRVGDVESNLGRYPA